MNRFFFPLLVIVAVCMMIPQVLLAQNVKQVAELSDPQNQEDDQFGYSVAINGNLAAVGAPQFGQDQSYAYLYAKQDNSWVKVATLKDGVGSDQFGWAVAVSENVVAVSTPHAGVGGAVFIFEKPQGGWKDMLPTAELSIPANGDGFGDSLAISNDGSVVAAGAPGGSITAVYVFVEPAGGWIDSTSSNAGLSSPNGHQVGISVAMSGNTIIAGDAGLSNPQAAFVFNKPAGGWSGSVEPTATLTASDWTSIDHFSASLAISGNTIAVGAPFHHDKPGTVYIYTEPKTGWQDMTQTAELSVPVNLSLQLGHSVALSGNLVLAGAPTNTIGRNSKQGSVIGYLKPAGGWKNTTSPSGAASAFDGQAGEQFGSSVAISGNNVIVGAPNYDGLIGAAYIFSLQ